MKLKLKLNNKRGISLIVLVITIIVMVILAATIILSLQSSGIIGRANEARANNDTASYKEMVTVAHAEWLLMDEETQKKNGGDFKSYAEGRLNKQGYETNSYIINEDGTVEKCLAVIGDKKYSSLSDAIKSIGTSDQVNVRLMNDISLEYQIEILNKKDVVIDLNGYSITSLAYLPALIINRGSLTLKDTSENKTGRIESLLNEKNHKNYGATYDYDNDGYITYEDANMIAKYYVNSSSVDASLVDRLDVDKNGTVNMTDCGIVISDYFSITYAIRSSSLGTLVIDETMEDKIFGKPAAITNKLT